MEYMKKVKGTWHISLQYECPECGYTHDFTTEDDWSDVVDVCESKKDIDCEVKCKKCGIEFILDETEY